MLSNTDQQILKAIQDDALVTAQELGLRVNLSASQVTRRRHKLEAQGYIAKFSALLNPQQLGLNVQSFAEVTLLNQKNSLRQAFEQFATEIPAIVGIWQLNGDPDYLIRLFCRDINQLNELLYETLLEHESVSKIENQIVMKQPKIDMSLPLPESPKRNE